jgi:hypothetical protein
MLKYFAERGGDAHKGLLHWPGTPDGYPYRGDAAPHLRQDEINQVELALDYQSRMFCLWDTADKRAFDEVMDRIVNGWYMQHKRQDVWDAEHQHYRVWLEWVQVYGETPHGKHPGASGSGTDGNDTQQDKITIRPGAAPSGEPLDLLSPIR